MKNNCIIFAFFCFGLWGHAQEKVSIDFNRVIHEIAENNTEIKSINANYSSAAQSLKSNNNLPNPEIDYSHVFGSAGQKWELSASQHIEWPGVYTSRGHTNSAEIDALKSASHARELEILLEIKLTIIKLIHNHRLSLLYAEQTDLINELAEKYNMSYEHGNCTIIDINKLKIEKISVEQRTLDCERNRAALMGELRRLNGGKDAPELFNLIGRSEYPVENALSIADYERLVAEFDPTVRQNALLSYVETLRLNQLSKESLPGFSLGYKHSYELGDHFNGFSVGITLPFFSHRHKKAAIQMQKDAFDIAGNHALNEKINLIKEELSQVEILNSQLSAYGPVIHDNRNIETLRKALNGGQISLLTFIQERNYFLESEIHFIDLERDYALSMAKLNRYSLLRN